MPSDFLYFRPFYPNARRNDMRETEFVHPAADAQTYDSLVRRFTDG